MTASSTYENSSKYSLIKQGFGFVKRKRRLAFKFSYAEALVQRVTYRFALKKSSKRMASAPCLFRSN
jgi:hypothetical protein